MGWLTKEVYAQLRRDLEALTEEQKRGMTWDDGWQFVAQDTLEIAAYQGECNRKDRTPYEIVARLRGIV